MAIDLSFSWAATVPLKNNRPSNILFILFIYNFVKSRSSHPGRLLP
jgi:hypothetical protein